MPWYAVNIRVQDNCCWRTVYRQAENEEAALVAAKQEFPVGRIFNQMDPVRVLEVVTVSEISPEQALACSI